MPSYSSQSTAKLSTTSERVLTAARSHLFGALLALCKDAQDFSSISVVLLVVEWVQVLSFPLSDHKSLPWHTGAHWALQPLSKFLSFISMNHMDSYAGSVRIFRMSIVSSTVPLLV
jgi:hypothetical protein